jgi:hypothetical protein
LEYTYEEDEASLYTGATHHMDVAGQMLAGWFRYEVPTPLRLLRLQPGLSMGYNWGDIQFRRVEDNADMTMVKCNGPVWSAGLRAVIGAWFERGGISIFIEYRYRWAESDVVELPNDGEFFFDESIPVDYSGHIFSVGIGGHYTLKR